MPTPLVSVIIPSFNHAPYIVEAMASVLNQTLSDLELIVIDDRSTDESWHLIQSVSDPRLQYHRNEVNLGAHETINQGLQMARGEYIAILNSDDRYSPIRLETLVRKLKETGADLVGSDIELVDLQGQIIKTHWWLDFLSEIKTVLQDTGDWRACLLYGNLLMTTSNFVMNRNLYLSIGGFSAHRYVHDYDFLLRTLIQGKKIEWHSQVLLSYRFHQSNTISENPLDANLETMALLRYHAPALLSEPPVSSTRTLQFCRQIERLEKYEIEILRAIQHERLSLKDQEYGAMIADRDRWIADRDRWIADRDRWIAERDDIIQHLEHRVQHLDQMIDLKTKSLQWIEARPLRYAAQRLRERLRNRVAKPILFFQSLQGSRIRADRVTSFSRLRDLLEGKSSDTLRCISFDVFDTLLFRCIEPPEWLHLRAAQEISRWLEFRHSSEAILSARQQAEAKLRIKNVQDGKDHECHFDDLVKSWLEQLGENHDPDLVQFIHETELMLELLALDHKPSALLFLRWAKEQGYRLIAISDMYLGEEQIRAIFRARQIDEFIDQIYVSADHGIAKHSGRLFELVLQRENLRPNELLHVGDNFHADAHAPSRLGIRGVFLDEASQRRRRKRQTLAAEMANRGGVWPGRMFNEVLIERLRHTQEAKHDSFFFQYGLEVLGPAFSTFLLGMVEMLQQVRPECVFFLARDGFLFQKMYDGWRDRHPNLGLPASRYLYASRKVVSCAAIADGLDHAKALIALYNPKQQGLLSVLKTYGLPPEDFLALADKHGFTEIDAPLSNWEDPRLITFLADDDVQAHIRPHGKKAKCLLERYFEQEGFFSGGRVALCDIGWNGTIQRFLASNFGSRTDYPEVSGYYFALMNTLHAGENNPKTGDLHGLILDGDRGNPCERAAFDFEELFEQGARSAEGTTLRYGEEHGRIVAKLKADDAPDRLQEIACNPLIAELQAGVMLHLRHFMDVQQLTGFSFAELKPHCLGILERAVVYPTPEEVSHIGKLAHSEDFGHDHLLDISAGDIHLRDFLRPRHLVEKIRKLAWRFAPFARFPTPIPALLCRYLHLRHLDRKNP